MMKNHSGGKVIKRPRPSQLLYSFENENSAFSVHTHLTNSSSVRSRKYRKLWDFFKTDFLNS